MCEGCWNDYGSPKLLTENVKKMVAMLPDVNPYGAFHIYVDDFNIDDDDLRFCMSEAEATPREIEFGKIAAASSIDERASALALYDGYWVPEQGQLIAAKEE
jgi:hypothetical protein